MISVRGAEQELGIAPLLAMLPSLIGMFKGGGAAGGGAPAGSGSLTDLISAFLRPPTPTAPTYPQAGSYVFCPPGQVPNPTFAAIPIEARAQAAAAGIQACMPATGVPGAGGAAGVRMSPSGAQGCMPGEVYGPSFNICYNPNMYPSEAAAYAALTGGKRPRRAAQPAYAPETARGGRRRPRRRRRGRGMRGVYLDEVAGALGAADTSAHKWANAGIVVGTLLVAAGAAIGLTQKHRRRRR